jgi:3-deoxy-D-manno-octulosonic-acid transferase
MMIFHIFYSIIAIALHLIALPFILLLSLKTKYRRSLPARFLWWDNRALKKGGVWFHSCSFGEAKAIAPLVQALPQESLRMSTTTQTGLGVIQNYTEESRFLPFESLLPFWVQPHHILVVMEAEFWYGMFFYAKLRGAKTVLVNARMSDRSFPKYLKMRWFYKRIFQYVDEVYAQTALDKERLLQLGAKCVVVTGNIKLAQLPKVSTYYEKPKGLTICAASTHEGEERLLFEAFHRLKQEKRETKLLVVPRHPERFGRVKSLLTSLCQKESYKFGAFTQGGSVWQCDVILCDQLGELVNLYAVSDVVLLGGSFVPAGGHNAAEAAQFGCKILSGPHYFNQRDIYAAIDGIEVVEAEGVTQRLLGYAQLTPCSLRTTANITPILKSLKGDDYA